MKQNPIFFGRKVQNKHLARGVVTDLGKVSVPFVTSHFMNSGASTGSRGWTFLIAWEFTDKHATFTLTFFPIFKLFLFIMQTSNFVTVTVLK